MTRCLAYALVLIASVSCSSLDEPTTAADGNSIEVSRADFGKKWPLTVSSGTLSCKEPGQVFFETGGTVYTVNGMAATMTDLPEIDPLWKDAPHGLKKNIGPLIQRGLSLCK